MKILILQCLLIFLCFQSVLTDKFLRKYRKGAIRSYHLDEDFRDVPSLDTSEDPLIEFERSELPSRLLRHKKFSLSSMASFFEMRKFPRWEYQFRPGAIKKIYGFSFCKHIDGSYFDLSLPVDRRNFIDMNRSSILGEKIEKSSLIDERENIASPNTDSTAGVRKREKWWKSLVNWFKSLWQKVRLNRPQTKPKNSHKSSHELSSGDVDEDIMIKFIDETAREIAQTLHQQYQLDVWGPSSDASVTKDSARLFGCFVAADGNNDWVKIVPKGIKRKFLQFVDGPTYFDQLPLFKQPSTDLVEQVSKNLAEGRYRYSPSQKDRICQNIKNPFASFPSGHEVAPTYDRTVRIRAHRLAYLLLVHKNFEEVVALINALIDPYVVIMIHVDDKVPQLKGKLIQYVQKMKKVEPYFRRVKVMHRSVKCAWGHASLARAQMAGFFELMDFNNDWEYVVNLSGNDYPLRHNDVIYHDLKRNYDGKNLIQYWAAASHTTDRLYTKPFLLNENGHAGIAKKRQSTTQKREATEERMIHFPYSEFKLVGHHQWMVLHRSFIEWMRNSPLTMQLLAFSEFAIVPDENFFGTLALNSPFQGRIVNTCKRFLWFPPGAAHPKKVTMSDFPNIVKAIENGDGWTRKVEISCSKGLLNCINSHRDAEHDLIFGSNSVDKFHSPNF